MLVWRDRCMIWITLELSSLPRRKSWLRNVQSLKLTMQSRIVPFAKVNLLHQRRKPLRKSSERSAEDSTRISLCSTMRFWLTLGRRMSKHANSTTATWPKGHRQRPCRLDRTQAWWKLTFQSLSPASKTLGIRRRWVMPKSKRSWQRSEELIRKTWSLNFRCLAAVTLMLIRKLDTLKLSERWRWNFNISYKIKVSRPRWLKSSWKKKRKSAKKCLTWKSRPSKH